MILGVKDNGIITGISREHCSKIITDFVTSLNNPQKISPPLYLSPVPVEIDGKTVIVIHVPESPQVHSLNGRIFDRNADGDFDITRYTDRVATLFLRKQKVYTENTVYPFATLADLRPDIIRRVRMRAANRQEAPHAWTPLGDEELLRSAGLYKRDMQTGKDGLTLAAILLFGKDETIINALPHHRTDAILRRINLDRYDDRDDVRTNLIESYDRLMAFIAKHLSDPFYLEGQVRISLRDKIFREAVVNSLIHREYANAFVAKMVIENGRVVFENASIANGFGRIDPNNFVPHPKNPTLAKLFREIGLADELGSGVRNLYRYSKVYSHKDPELIEGDIFRVYVAIPAQTTPQATMQAAMQDERTNKIVEFCRIPRNREEIQKFVNIANRDYFRKEILNPLLEKGLLHPTIPDKPTSPKQKYYSVTKGENP